MADLALIRQNREKQLLALYNLLGIPPQYNEDGSIKNIFELLGIQPEFDDYGQRVPTIYEVLEILPKFDSNYNEIPSIVFIKNKVSKFAVNAPGNLSNLTQKLSAKDMENLDKEKALETKIKIAVLAGNNKKAANINNKLKSMPKRTQKYQPLITVGSKAKTIFSGNKLIDSDFIKSLFNINISINNQKDESAMAQPEKHYSKTDNSVIKIPNNSRTYQNEPSPEQNSFVKLSVKKVKVIHVDNSITNNNSVIKVNERT